MLKKKLNDDSGYALLTVLLVSVLVFLLAMSLFFITSNGTKKTVVREHLVQAQELSEKGLKHLLNQINNELNDAIKNNNGTMTKPEFLESMSKILEKYSCDTNTLGKLKESDGNYEACLNDLGDEDEVFRKVEFVSKGLKGKQEKEVKTQMKIGADSTLGALNYAINVPKSKECLENSRNCFPGEGNVLLHGGVNILGNIRVDGDIGTVDKARIGYGNNSYWVPTHLPSIRPVSGIGRANLSLGGEVYEIRDVDRISNVREYDRHIASNMANGSGSRAKFVEATSNLNRVFKDAPRIVNADKKVDEVDVVSIINNTRNTTNVNTLFLSDISYTSNLNRPTKVYGDLMIGDFSNRPRKRGVELRNTLYVEGNLHVRHADLLANALIYVKGNVTIEESTIGTLTNNQNEDGTLFIFSEGTIRMVNNSVNLDDPSVINGFFYANDAVEMYGAGSNIYIRGGLSANRLVFNAVKGKTRSTRDRVNNITEQYGNTYYQRPRNQGDNSRLTVEYDPEIIEKHHSLNNEEDLIQEVLPPVIINRE